MLVDNNTSGKTKIASTVAKRVLRKMAESQKYCTRCGMTWNGAISLKVNMIQIQEHPDASPFWVCDECLKYVMVVDQDQDESLDQNWSSSVSTAGEECNFCRSELFLAPEPKENTVQQLLDHNGWTLYRRKNIYRRKRRKYVFCSSCIAAVFRL